MKRLISLTLSSVLMISSALINTTNCLAEDYDDISGIYDTTKEATVCLDAGHDYKHTGADGFGLDEEDVNFKITEYCKAYLEENSNIRVVLTHETMECPYPDTPYEDCNYERVVQASNDGADIYVSIHANAESTGTSSGIHFIYPQSNWRSQFNTLGLQFLECLKNSGIQDILPVTKSYTRDTTDDEVNSTDFYPDESRADYYGVIRTSKYFNMLGVIIEHGFITTKEDNDYLVDDAYLQAFGEADAKSIIAYFNQQGFNTEKPVESSSLKVNPEVREHLKMIMSSPMVDKHNLISTRIIPANPTEKTLFSIQNKILSKL